jgi:hypothetical protein
MDASALSPASTYGELLVPKDWSVIGCSFIEEVNALKRSPWHTILIGVAVFLVLVGVAPLAYLLWWGNAHNLEPLSVPLSLKRGEYTSPFLKRTWTMIIRSKYISSLIIGLHWTLTGRSWMRAGG